MQALTIRTSGFSISELDQQDVLRSLQTEVGGFIEPVAFPLDGISAYVNEEGKLRRGFSKNELATAMVRGYLMEGDYIAGPMVLVGLDEDGETTGLTDEQVAEVSALIASV